jgi:benzoyl-CoA reductase subunit A
MKKYYLGVDLGSTTSKAVIINEQDEIIGRGITNTRSNYEIAAEIARLESIYNARFSLLKRKLKNESFFRNEYRRYVEEIEDVFQYLQFKIRLDELYAQLKQTAKQFFSADRVQQATQYIDQIVSSIGPSIKKDFLEGDLGSKSQFFRDVVGEKYHEEVGKVDKDFFEALMVTFDKSINPVENKLVDIEFGDLVDQSMDVLNEKYAEIGDSPSEEASLNFDAELNLLTGNYKKVSDSLREHIDHIAQMEIHIANMTGTGYGRALLPFPEDCIKSEILCHAFGAHAVFPQTRTVLDIGGQDTKAIQVDGYGLVTSFHMNDRCAAGCGRYLGYIADELNISLNELGPLALEANKEVDICSTCTVFAGAELRELMNIGERREDILGGLHKAIVMRAISLLARSGGVRNEFTFTGGVARNQAALKYLTDLIRQNYGEDLTINTHPDSIFMGSLGAAMFARRNIDVDLPQKQKKRVVKKAG